jgi:hypothetical protein
LLAKRTTNVSWYRMTSPPPRCFSNGWLNFKQTL